jgi:REP element-mobilizing transposase RayT
MRHTCAQSSPRRRYSATETPQLQEERGLFRGAIVRCQVPGTGQEQHQEQLWNKSEPTSKNRRLRRLGGCTFGGMPRKPRLQDPGLYHVGCRGNNKQPIFDDLIRELVLHKLCFIASEYEWSILAWALMTNHFHLVIRVGDSGLAAGMQRLNLFLATISNSRFSRTNHCVGDRYWNRPLETDARVLVCLRYVMWNPVRANLVDDPADSTWTSYRASAGLAKAHPVLALDQLLPMFGPAPLAAHQGFAAFVETGRDRAIRVRARRESVR